MSNRLRCPRFPLWVTIIAAALNGGCLGPGTTRPLKYYVLSPVALEQSQPSVPKRIGILPVRFPGYLDRPALIVRSGAEVLPLPFSAWAAPLEREFARIFAENLLRLHPASDVSIFPWRRSFEPDNRLAIDVARFEVEDRTAILHARWRILGPNGAGPAATKDTRISVPVAGEDDQARVAALSAALGRLSAEVARVLD
jgi:uncharacterized lipoprotein YmbA